MASVAEIASGIAVVVTLMLLFFGIRENSMITRASVYAETMREVNAGEQVILADPELSRVFEAFLSDDRSMLHDDDRIRLTLIVAGMARRYDTAHAMWNYGLFGPNEWGRFANAICANYRRAEGLGVENIFLNIASDEFQSFVQSEC